MNDFSEHQATTTQIWLRWHWPSWKCLHICCIFNRWRSSVTHFCLISWRTRLKTPSIAIITNIPKEWIDHESFVQIKAKSELGTLLGKISQQVEALWLRVRRGDRIIKLRVRAVAERNSMLQKKYTIRAAKDDRHVAIIGDLTFEQCTELQGRFLPSLFTMPYNLFPLHDLWKINIVPNTQSIIPQDNLTSFPFEWSYVLINE